MNMQDHSAHWKGLASDGTGIPTSCHVILLFGSEERHIGKKAEIIRRDDYGYGQQKSPEG